MREEWEQLARELDLEFKEGLTALFESPSLQAIAGAELGMQNIEKLEQWLKNPLLKKLAEKAFEGAITGQYRSFEVALFRGSQSTKSGKIYHVNVSLFFKQRYNHGMKISAHDFFSRIGKKIFSGSYVLPQGHRSEFNDLICVKAGNKGHVQMLLSDGRIQDRLIELFMFSKNFTIDDIGIRYREYGQIIAAEQARLILDMMSSVAETFY